MSNTPAPLLEALIAYLGSQTAITNLVSTRIFGQSLPDAEAKSMPRKCLVLRMAPRVGGLLQIDQNYIESAFTTGIDVWSYGETEIEAIKLHREAHLILKRIQQIEIDGVLIRSVDAPGNGISLKDPDGNWPLMIEQCSVLAAEVTTT